MIEHNKSMGGTDDQSSSLIHLDTSRFAVNQLKDYAATTNRSNISTLSYLVDPKEHLRGLKSPLKEKLVNYFDRHTSNSRSRSPPAGVTMRHENSNVSYSQPIVV